jgi:hypothetical protein
MRCSSVPVFGRSSHTGRKALPAREASSAVAHVPRPCLSPAGTALQQGFTVGEDG